jgi:hypothetical protein
MSPAKSEEKGSKQQAAPCQGRTDPGLAPGAKYTEQVTQPIKQEVSIAIINSSNPILTPSEITAF